MWSGLGQTFPSLPPLFPSSSPPTPLGQPVPVTVGEVVSYTQTYNDPGRTWMWVGTLGTVYTEDNYGNWTLLDASGFKAWGGADGGYCDSTGFCSGSWATSAPAKVQAIKAVAKRPANPTPTTTTGTPQATTPPPTTPPPATTPGTTGATPGPGGPPPSIETPGDQKVAEYHDQYGSLVQKFASGASYYEYTDGTWTYQDGQGNQWDGDAAGNYCDSWGNCTGAWAGGPPQTPSSGWMPLVLIGGAAVFLLLLAGGGGGGRRRR